MVLSLTMKTEKGILKGNDRCIRKSRVARELQTRGSVRLGEAEDNGVGLKMGMVVRKRYRIDRLHRA